jgi:Double zinc ribbon
MLCTFCGTENHPENKFCGMCGVRLERRKAERRARHDNLKCPSCGHTNEQSQKFCGMCGSGVDRRTQDRRATSSGPRATAVANAQLPTPEVLGRGGESASSLVASAPPKETPAPPVSEIPSYSRTPPAIFRDEPGRTPSIGGPSFLGLSDGPEDEGDYLLEDEASSGSVLRKLVLIAILGAVGGLILVGWRSGFLANPKFPQPAKPQPTASPLPQSNSAAPVADGSQKNSAGSAPPDQSPAAAGLGDTKEAQPIDSKAASAAAGEKPLDAAPEKPAPARQKVSEEMPAGSRKPSAALVQAQNYLQGKGGVGQSCEQGLIYLKAAAQKNEPAAAVQMGALYASGHCVQQDRVTAYRWFNSAHELDPANPWIQTNLDQLWAQMTPQERQRAGQ